MFIVLSNQIDAAKFTNYIHLLLFILVMFCIKNINVLKKPFHIK